MLAYKRRRTLRDLVQAVPRHKTAKAPPKISQKWVATNIATVMHVIHLSVASTFHAHVGDNRYQIRDCFNCNTDFVYILKCPCGGRGMAENVARCTVCELRQISILLAC